MRKGHSSLDAALGVGDAGGMSLELVDAAWSGGSAIVGVHRRSSAGPNPPAPYEQSAVGSPG